MVINQYSNWTAFKILINCRSWHLLTQCHILISLVLHHLMAKVGNSQRKSEIRWLVRRWHVMTCPCFPHEPTKVYGSTNKQFSLRHVVPKTSGNRNLWLLLKDSPKFHSLKKKNNSDFPHSSQIRPWSFTVIIPLSLRRVSPSKKWQRNRKVSLFHLCFWNLWFQQKGEGTPRITGFFGPPKEKTFRTSYMVQNSFCFWLISWQTGKHTTHASSGEQNGNQSPSSIHT